MTTGNDSESAVQYRPSYAGLAKCVMRIQGDPSGQRLHFVDFDLVDTMSALFCLGMQHGGTPKSNSIKYSR